MIDCDPSSAGVPPVGLGAVMADTGGTPALLRRQCQDAPDVAAKQRAASREFDKLGNDILRQMKREGGESDEAG